MDFVWDVVKWVLYILAGFTVVLWIFVLMPVIIVESRKEGRKVEKGDRMLREDDLRRALEIEKPEEEGKEKTREDKGSKARELKEDVRLGILSRAAKQLVTERKVPKKRKGNWHFGLGKHKWGFWLMISAFALFLLFQFIIRPLLIGG